MQSNKGNLLQSGFSLLETCVTLMLLTLLIAAMLFVQFNLTQLIHNIKIESNDDVPWQRF